MRGVKSKIQSIRKIVEDHDPVILAVTETKMKDGEMVDIEGYMIDRVDRKEREGGGVMLAYKESLRNIITIIKEETENCEILWVKIDNGKTKLKIAVVYMPQENKIKKKDLKDIYKKIEMEVMLARNNKESVLIMGDFNCKVGNVNTW